MITNEITSQQTFSLSLSVRGKASARRCSRVYIKRREHALRLRSRAFSLREAALALSPALSTDAERQALRALQSRPPAAQAMEQVRFAEGKKRLGHGRPRVFRSLEIDRLCLRSRALPEAGSEALNVC